MTARTLITKAYYLSGIVSRTFQTVTGAQLSDGLELLNEILSVRSVDSSKIPYFKELDITAVAGQEEYFVDGLIHVETLTFNIGDVRYSMSSKTRDPYFGDARVDNINTLPFSWHVERTLGGSNLYIYFKPDTAYPLKLWGKFGLDSVATADVDLSLTYDNFYLVFLKYLLARYICDDYNINMPPMAISKLKQLEKLVSDVSPLDLTIEKISSFNVQSGINYGDVNIGRGWRP